MTRNTKRESFGRRLRGYRARAEQAIGRPLKSTEEVHHHTEAPESDLVICQDHHYHIALHARLRVLRAGGDPFTEAICGGCQVLKPLAEFSPNRAASSGRSYRCKSCERQRKRKFPDGRDRINKPRAVAA